MTNSPIEYTVSIDFSGLGGAAPSDGTMDEEKVWEYVGNPQVTGSSYTPPNLGDFVQINNYPVTIVTGTDVDSVVIDINNLSRHHHVIASDNGGNLSLINEELYTQDPISVCDGTPGITAKLGFDSPTSSAPSFPTTLAQSLAKTRGNLRWNNMVARISQTMTVNIVHNIVITGETLWTVDPTSISFNIILDNEQPYGYDLSGNLVYGIPALQNAIAQSLMDSDTLVVDVYDPTAATPAPHLPE